MIRAPVVLCAGNDPITEDVLRELSMVTYPTATKHVTFSRVPFSTKEHGTHFCVTLVGRVSERIVSKIATPRPTGWTPYDKQVSGLLDRT